MMNARTRPPDPERLLTAEEYARLPEDDRWRDELVRGRIIREPHPGWPHGRAQSRLCAQLLRFADEHHLGLVTVETGFVLERGPDTVRGPDVAFVRRERYGDTLPTGWSEFGPDLAVEVLSPSNRPGEMAEKLAQYFAAGTRLAWVVDPTRRRAKVYHPDGTSRVLHEHDDLDGEDVLPGFRCCLADVLD